MSTIFSTQRTIYPPADHAVQQPIHLLQTAAAPALQDWQVFF